MYSDYNNMEEQYLQYFHKAVALDDKAHELENTGRNEDVARLFKQASSMYAHAAAILLDNMEQYDLEEQQDVQKSVDRLIDASREMKQKAEMLNKHRSDMDHEDPPSFLPVQEEEMDIDMKDAEKDEIQFDDIAGLEDAKQLVMDEIINPLLYKRLYSRFKVENNGGLLLFGPPGGGKTMMARAIAGQANMAFFSVRCSDIVGKYFGEAEKHVQALFEAAREAKNAVIFFDEAEALACRRGGNSTVMNRLVPELLSQMDGFQKDEGHIIVIFATNRPYDLDPAFLRPGRLPNHCYIPLPDYNVRRTFLQKLVANRPCQGAIDTEALARKTENFSCADLVNLVKRSCQRPINRSIAREKQGEKEPEEFLTMEDLECTLEKLEPSVEPEDVERLEKWMNKKKRALANKRKIA